MKITKIENEIFEDLLQIFKKYEKLFDLECKLFTINEDGNVENITVGLERTKDFKIKATKRKVIETEDYL